MTGRILWLTNPSFSSKTQYSTTKYFHKAGINPATVFFTSLHKRIANMWVNKGKSKVMTWNIELNNRVLQEVDKLIETMKPKIIVIQDRATLGYITGKYSSLDLCQGSVYDYRGIPCLVINELHTTKYIRHGVWLLLAHMMKIRRWQSDEQHPEPKFRYTICSSRSDIDNFCRIGGNWLVCSGDIETAKGLITVISYCGVDSAGRMHTFIIPFVNPLKEGNRHWDTIADEIYAWQALRDFNAGPVIKCFQNGSYDACYLIKYHIPLKNYLCDTIHLWHSVWCELPKKLNFISSVLVDNCKYWKDESKGDKADKDKAERVPYTPEGFARYLRYNGLDSYFTLMALLQLLQLFGSETNKWIRDNYTKEFADQVGPDLMMMMTGMLTQKERQAIKYRQWVKESKKNLEVLRIMVDDPEFNPNSSTQFSSLLYDVLGVRPMKTRGKKSKPERTVDEKVLRILRTQHPLYARFIDQVWSVKKPLNNASKYGAMITPCNRFLYSLSACGTNTWRKASKSHPYWVGTNAQNIPKEHRDMFIADEGYIFFEADYSQSDAWFVAYTCEDSTYIKNISDDRNTHCAHAEFFFKVPYEKVYEGHKNEEDWTDHPVTGIYNNTKRITHGANFRMQGFTLYIQMGHDETVAAAKFLGFQDAHLWSLKQIIQFCDQLLQQFHVLYPRLPEWFSESVVDVLKNNNKAVNAFGYTRRFIGDLAEDAEMQRQLSAFYGQSGTGGNINRSAREIYYETDLIQRGLLLLHQIHDALMFGIPYKHFHSMAKEILTIMRKPCTIKGRTFSVPVEAKVGLSWGKKSMIPYRKDMTVEEIIAHEKWYGEKFYPEIGLAA